jgi:hypothetical protein
MDMSDQLYTLVTVHPPLPPQKETPLLTEQEAGWDPQPVRRSHLPGTEITILGLFGLLPITTPTALSWLVKLFGA